MTLVDVASVKRLVELNVDGHEVRVTEGSTILDACRLRLGARPAGPVDLQIGHETRFPGRCRSLLAAYCAPVHPAV